MKLLSITIILNTKGLTIKTNELELIKETPKTYKCKVMDGFWAGITRQINKSKLMDVNSKLLNSISSETPTLSYHTYCLAEDKERAIDLLIGATSLRISLLTKGVSLLNKSLINSEYT